MEKNLGNTKLTFKRGMFSFIINDDIYGDCLLVEYKPRENGTERDLAFRQLYYVDVTKDTREKAWKLLNEKFDEITSPKMITELKKNEIFVFGSNLEGRHLGGAARMALDNFGAEFGNGDGIQGQSYGIPTMHGGVDVIKPYVDKFYEYAESHKDKIFLVTEIGCGIAGFTPSEIAPLFVNCVKLDNVKLPKSFYYALSENY